jgi:hypothetical protein
VGIVVGLIFTACTLLLLVYKLDKKTTIQMAEELAARRASAAAAKGSA